MGWTKIKEGVTSGNQLRALRPVAHILRLIITIAMAHNEYQLDEYFIIALL